MVDNVRERRTGPKCVAILGPMSSGKTTLLEAMLARSGAIHQQNSVASGNSVGDASAEARQHGMSVEATFVSTDFMGEPITFVDCPGSVEFSFEADPVLAAVDMAVVVTEADDAKIPALQHILKKLDARGIPRVLFLNKIDKAVMGVRDALKLLQPASASPLLLRQIPIRSQGEAVGAIDLALERAYIYRQGEESEVTEIPNEEKAREVEARFSMLETMADYDDSLMEQLLEDIEPSVDTVFSDLSSDLQKGLLTPVLIGSAENGNGALRLLKTIRHDGPDIDQTCQRLGIASDGGFLGRVMKTVHNPHSGKLSFVRVLRGQVSDGSQIAGQDGASMRISGLYRPMAGGAEKISSANVGDLVGLGKLDGAATGNFIAQEKSDNIPIDMPERPYPVYSISVHAVERRDEVKMSAALTRLGEEDPSLSMEHQQGSGELVLHGNGEMHLRIAIERLENRSQIKVLTGVPVIPYRETIARATTQRGRHKKQSGGHGQFGDVTLEIRPQESNAGINFTNTITGGVVPKQYIPSVEHGVREYLERGPLGFPVVDVTVNLADGSYHSVDSSDMAFQMAGKVAMREGMPHCGSVLLEPVMKVTIDTPNDATNRVNAIISQRRGRMLGFGPREDWPGWDTVEALMPQADIGDMIIELRSATAGGATYAAEFDHMARVEQRLADAIIKARAEAA